MTERSITRAVLAIALAGGALGWILIGAWTGAIGVLITVGLGVLMVAGIARAMGIDP